MHLLCKISHPHPTRSLNHKSIIFKTFQSLWKIINPQRQHRTHLQSQFIQHHTIKSISNSRQALTYRSTIYTTPRARANRRIFTYPHFAMTRSVAPLTSRKKAEIKMNSGEHLKEEILKSMQRMFSGNTSPLLLEALNFYFPGLDFALIIKFIPEQAEDIFLIMIDPNKQHSWKFPGKAKKLSDVKNELIDIHTYKNQAISKESRKRLNAAEKLMLLKYKSNYPD